MLEFVRHLLLKKKSVSMGKDCTLCTDTHTGTHMSGRVLLYLVARGEMQFREFSFHQMCDFKGFCSIKIMGRSLECLKWQQIV